MENEELHGELTTAQRTELNKLLSEMKAINSYNLMARNIAQKAIKKLPQDKDLKLWEIFNHVAKMFTCWTNVKGAIAMYAKYSNMAYSEAREQLMTDCMVWMYTYAWRHFEACEKPEGILYTSCRSAYMSWKEQIKFEEVVEAMNILRENLEKSSGQKIKRARNPDSIKDPMAYYAY